MVLEKPGWFRWHLTHSVPDGEELQKQMCSTLRGYIFGAPLRNYSEYGVYDCPVEILTSVMDEEEPECGQISQEVTDKANEVVLPKSGLKKKEAY